MQWSLTRALGLLWYAQLDLRLLPHILHTYFTGGGGGGGAQRRQPLSLTESFGAVMHNLTLHQWLMGQVSHEVGWHDEVLAFLQRECAFRAGELTCVVVYAFGSLSHLRAGESAVEPLEGSGRWLVKDAAEGLKMEGRQSAVAMAEQIRRPSDLARLSNKGGNKERSE